MNDPSQVEARTLASDTALAIAVILILFGRKDFLPVEPQSGLSFLFLLGAPRFA
jgi:hypothetical protein